MERRLLDYLIGLVEQLNDDGRVAEEIDGHEKVAVDVGTVDLQSLLICL